MLFVYWFVMVVVGGGGGRGGTQICSAVMPVPIIDMVGGWLVCEILPGELNK